MRTNTEIDDKHMQKAMRYDGFRVKKATVEATHNYTVLHRLQNVILVDSTSGTTCFNLGDNPTA